MNNVLVHGVNAEQLSEAVGLSVVALRDIAKTMFVSTRLDPCVSVTRIGGSVVFFFSAATEINGYNDFNQELLSKFDFAKTYYAGDVDAVFLASRNAVYEYGEETDKPVDFETLHAWLTEHTTTLTTSDPIPLTMDLINEKTLPVAERT